jgi:hypothetical protein
MAAQLAVVSGAWQEQPPPPRSFGEPAPAYPDEEAADGDGSPTYFGAAR